MNMDMNMRRMASTLAAVAACAGLIWTAGAAVSTWAQGGGSLQPEGVVGPLLQYQGRLTNAATSEPISGSTFMTFRIYDVLSGGIPLWSETETIQVSNGLFSTVLGDGATPMQEQMFNGQELWLEVKVEGEDTSPRQQLLPVAYALGLAPGATISWTSNSPALLVRNRGAGVALQVEGNLYVSGNLIGGAHPHNGADISSGMVAEARIDPLIARDTEVTAAVNNATANVRRNYYDQRAGAGTAYTITIPHFQLWRLELASDWPGTGGIAVLEGFENDGNTAVTFTKYDGTGVGASGGAKCACGSGSTLLVFGSGSNTYGVSCPAGYGNCPGPNYSLVITRSGSLPVNFKLVY